VLHFATTASARLQTEIRAMGFHTLGGFTVNLLQAALLPVVLFSMDVGTDHFKRQRTFNEHHLAIAPVRNALGFQVHGFNG
jgi:hypothetical protein